MGDVTITAAIRSTLQNLQGTQSRLDSTQLRLSTGKKVNSALDSANAFFAAQSLSFRAADLTRLLDGMNQGGQVLKAADHGIEALTALVTQAKAIAQEVRDETPAAIDVAYLSGDVPTGFVFPLGLSILITQAPPAYQGIAALSSYTLAQVVGHLNAGVGHPFRAEVVNGSVAGTQRLKITTLNNLPLTINWGSGAAYLNVSHAPIPGTGTGATDGYGTPYVMGTEINVTMTTNALARQQDFNVLLQQINQLVQDTGYRGTNLLNGDTMTQVFNESGSSALRVQGVTFNAAGLGLTTTSLATVNDVDRILRETQGALDLLRTQAKIFGTSLSIIEGRTNFTLITANNLKEGADKLILADANEEGANMLALQTAQQLGLTALSLAARAAQSILRLFSSR